MEIAYTSKSSNEVVRVSLKIVHNCLRFEINVLISDDIHINLTCPVNDDENMARG